MSRLFDAVLVAVVVLAVACLGRVAMLLVWGR
jgi:hypothetical protein